MKKSEIKNGAILKTRNGMCWFKVDNTLLEVTVQTGVSFGYMSWDNYNEDMKYSNHDYDVVGVDNNVNNGRGNCNQALANFLREKTVFIEVNNDPIVTEKVNSVLKFLLEFTPFEYIAKDGDGTHEIYLYKFKPKKAYELNPDGTRNESSWYWVGVAEEITNFFTSKEIKTFFNFLDPNRVYKIEDLIK